MTSRRSFLASASALIGASTVAKAALAARP
jgi:hypothetical protein